MLSQVWCSRKHGCCRRACSLSQSFFTVAKRVRCRRACSLSQALVLLFAYLFILLLLHSHSQGDTPWTPRKCSFVVGTPWDPQCAVAGMGTVVGIVVVAKRVRCCKACWLLQSVLAVAGMGAVASIVAVAERVCCRCCDRQRTVS